MDDRRMQRSRHPGTRPRTGRRARPRSPAVLALRATTLVPVALLALVLLAWPLAGRAGAHATLIATTPGDDELVERAPDAVELRFDEPVELVSGGSGGGGGGIQVIDPEGDRADRGQVGTADGGATLTVPIDGERRGTYTVAWRVLSEDGHNLSGSFVFHVGERTGAATLDDGGDTLTDAVGGVGRWAAFSGALVLDGAGILALLAVPHLRRRPRPPAGSAASPAGLANGPANRVDAPAGSALGHPVAAAGDEGAGTEPAAPAGQVAAKASSAVGIADPAPTDGDSDGSGLDGVADPAPTDGDTDGSGLDGVGATAVERRLRMVMLAAAVLGAVGMAAALVAQAADASGRSLVDAVGITPDVVLDTRNGVLGALRLGALLVAVVLLLVPVTARFPLAVAASVAGAVSLAGASLAGHAWTAPNRAVTVPSDVLHVLAAAAWLGGLVGLVAVLRRAPDRSALVHRFSSLSLVAVAVIAVTGTISGVVQVRTLDGLTSTGYGQLLLAKVAGFAVILLLGFYNRQILIPHLDRMLHRLARSVRAEVAVAAAVLAVTAALVNQPPARDQEEQAAGPVSTTVTSDDGAARLEAVVDPAEVGSNDVHLHFSGAEPGGSGSGAEPVVTAVEVTAAVGDVPPRRLTVTPVTPSHVSVLDASLTTAGTWSFQVTAVISGQPTTFTFEVPLR